MKRAYILLSALAFLIVASCSSPNTDKPKYVFYFIGDGMGIQHVNAAQLYLDSVEHYNNQTRISFLDFPVGSFATTYAANRYITGSAAAGTALSTGSKTSIGTIGLNADHSDSLFSIAKQFKQNGFKVGVVTSVSIDHATPAAFYAHQPERDNYYEISLDLARSGYNFFAGGPVKDPTGTRSNNPGISFYELAEKNGVAITDRLDLVDSLSKTSKTILYNAPNTASGNSLQYEIDRKEGDVSLADLTSAAITALHNPDGFFLMVEGGKIDWAAHDNDGAATIKEVIAFSQAVAKAVEFYNKYPNETLIVVTADHETGGLSIGNYLNGYNSNLAILREQSVSQGELATTIKNLKAEKPKASLNEVKDSLARYIGLFTVISPDDIESKELEKAYSVSFGGATSSKHYDSFNYNGVNDVAATGVAIVNRKAGLGWSSYSHTGSPVPVYVMGSGDALFKGSMTNTDIPLRILKATGIESR